MLKRALLVVAALALLFGGSFGAMWSFSAGQVETTWKKSRGGPLADPAFAEPADPAAWPALAEAATRVGEACEAEAALDDLAAATPSEPCKDASAVLIVTTRSGLRAPSSALLDGGGDLTELKHLLLAARVALAWTRQGDTTGDGSAGVEATLIAAQRVRHAGTLLSAMTGIAMADDTLTWLEGYEGGDEGWWRNIASALRFGADWPDPLRAALTDECRSLEPIFTPEGAREMGMPSSVAISLIYSPERSLWRHRAGCRQALEQLDVPRNQRVFQDDGELMQGVARYVDNPIGRILLSVGSIDPSRFLERNEDHEALRQRVLARAQQQATRAPNGANAPSPRAAPEAPSPSSPPGAGNGSQAAP